MISEKAIVETEDIGLNVIIMEFSIVRKGSKIGDNVIIHPNVVIESGVIIEDNVEVFPGTYIGKVPKGAGALARKPVFNEHVLIKKNCSIGPNAVIYYDVTIGEDTLIGDGASIREKCVIGSKCIISRYVTINYEATVGDRTKIMDLSHITGNSVIGNDVFISLHVGSANDNAIGKEGYDHERIMGPRINDGAVIGLGASLLPNITIGKDSIVGAGAVVTKDVLDGATVMGVPAKVIKSN
ncbi:transferase [Desulfitobacterium hafniense]|uniref:Transferase n=1 Tax=Desulfitobacterium hafniense TaxID=49338 RepID=A0A0W1JQB6_DESHA|nr:N-acetyltransferase [Desulfitobacterium hafniense]KTE93847.1 transferase [Desulfitobacterium hafniense]